MGKLIRIEFLKIKKSNVSNAAIGITLISLLTTLSGMTAIKETSPEGIWESLYIITMSTYSLFFYPILISIVVTMMVRLEYQNNMWKVLFANPVNKMKIYMAKLSCIFIIVGLAIGVTTLGMVTFGVIKTGDFTNIPSYIVLTPLKAYVASLAAITILYFISLRFKNFFIPLSIGFLGIFTSFFTTVSDKLYPFNPLGYASVLILKGNNTENFNMLILISAILMLITLFFIRFSFNNKDIT